MNKSESGSNFEVSKSFSIKDTLKRATASLLVAGALSGPMTGEVRAEQNPLTPSSTTTETGTMPSQRPEITDEYRENVVKIFNDFSQPVPVEDLKLIMEDWRQKTFGPYKEELKTQGVENEEMLGFGSRLLWAWDNARDMKDTNRFDKFQNYISREQIVDYALTGKGLNVYRDHEDRPRVLLVNTTKRMDKAFDAAIKWFEDNGAEDVLESFYNNGFCILFTTVTDQDRNPGSFLLTGWGLVSPNMSESNIKMFKNDTGLRDSMIRGLSVESYGIAHDQMWRALGYRGASIPHLEVVKSFLSGKVAESLGSSEAMKIFGSHTGTADDFAKRFSLNKNEPIIKREMQFLVEANMVDPIGFKNWQEIPSISDWVIGDK